MADIMIVRIPCADMNTAVSENLHQAIDQIVFSIGVCRKRLLKQFSLMLATIVRRLRKQDDQTGVKRKSGVLFEKIPAI